MDIHGFHVVSKLDADSEEGFATTVTHPDTVQIRGPFGTILEAVECAHAWNLEDPGAAKREEQNREKAKIEAAMKARAEMTEPPEAPVDPPKNPPDDETNKSTGVADPEKEAEST